MTSKDELMNKLGQESCLLKHFEMNDIRGETLVAISYNCGGQSKNWSLVAVWTNSFGIF